MDLMLIELVLWGGLLFFIWALKDGLGKVESDIESIGMLNRLRQSGGKQRRAVYHEPEQASDPIGNYLGRKIYRYVVIEGCRYEFSRVQPEGMESALEADERCVVPGLIYQQCPAGNRR